MQLIVQTKANIHPKFQLRLLGSFPLLLGWRFLFHHNLFRHRSGLRGCQSFDFFDAVTTSALCLVDLFLCSQLVVSWLPCFGLISFQILSGVSLQMCVSIDLTPATICIFLFCCHSLFRLWMYPIPLYKIVKPCFGIPIANPSSNNKSK